MMKEPHGGEPTAPLHPAIPPELLRFLTRRSYSLLIKGEAATGKTILALSILKELAAGDNFLYLSTRVSPSKLFENHTWLSDFAKKTQTERKPRRRRSLKQGRPTTGSSTPGSTSLYRSSKG